MPRSVTLTITIDNAGVISKQSIAVPTELKMDEAAIQAVIDEKVANGSIKFVEYRSDSNELDYQFKLGSFMTSTICARFNGWGTEGFMSRNYNPPMIEHVLQIEEPKPEARATPRP